MSQNAHYLQYTRKESDVLRVFYKIYHYPLSSPRVNDRDSFRWAIDLDLGHQHLHSCLIRDICGRLWLSSSSPPWRGILTVTNRGLKRLVGLKVQTRCWVYTSAQPMNPTINTCGVLKGPQLAQWRFWRLRHPSHNQPHHSKQSYMVNKVNPLSHHPCNPCIQPILLTTDLSNGWVLALHEDI